MEYYIRLLTPVEFSGVVAWFSCNYSFFLSENRMISSKIGLLAGCFVIR